MLVRESMVITGMMMLSVFDRMDIGTPKSLGTPNGLLVGVNPGSEKCSIKRFNM